MSRDYLNVKIWDVNMESKPVVTYNIHDYLKSKLVDLYENDCIFDKFECAWSGDDRWVASRYRVRALPRWLDFCGVRRAAYGCGEYTAWGLVCILFTRGNSRIATGTITKPQCFIEACLCALFY
jgi:hypothetical protein